MFVAVFFFTSSIGQASLIHKVLFPRLDQISSLICGTKGCKITESFSSDHLKFFSDNFFSKTELLRIFTNSYIFATDLLN
jgi:hypothetical protein